MVTGPLFPRSHLNQVTQLKPEHTATDSVYLLWKTYLLYTSYFLLEARKPKNKDTKLAGHMKEEGRWRKGKLRK